ncbi:MAG: hypothetical protein JWR39_1383 [Devosia sp.]|nr:hypothetical protein [Devosia sp.]
MTGKAFPPNLEVTSRGPLVLLFYDGFERKARPGIQGAAYSQARRWARYLLRTARRKQVHTGFYTAFLSLQHSLRELGCNVRVNDFAAAEHRPNYPIGVAGYPTVFEAVKLLSNPVIFGHGDIGPPEHANLVSQANNIRIVIQPGKWAADFLQPFLGDKLVVWPVGIDASQWNLPQEPSSTDFLVYDKIRWYRDVQVPRVLDHITTELDARGHSYKVVRYGHHIKHEFRAHLARSRALIFLCEHETQGIAYQEAMAAGVPVLAWDEGKLVDPVMLRYAPDLQVSSVPYFDERCGLTFTMDNFESTLSAFVAQRDHFRPQEFIRDRLSLERAGRDYLALYASLLGKPASGPPPVDTDVAP